MPQVKAPGEFMFQPLVKDNAPGESIHLLWRTFTQCQGELCAGTSWERNLVTCITVKSLGFDTSYSHGHMNNKASTLNNQCFCSRYIKKERFLITRSIRETTIASSRQGKTQVPGRYTQKPLAEETRRR